MVSEASVSAIAGIAGDILACLANQITSVRCSETKTFFLARDAYLPWVLLSELGPYVAVSRQSLRLPLLTRDPQRAVRWTIDRVTVNSVASVINRWGLPLDTVGGLLEKAGFPSKNWFNLLGRSAVRNFKKVLLSDDFLELADKHLYPLMNDTLQYLRDCGLLDETGGNVVDVGWNGSCHKHLQEYREIAGVSPAALGGIYVGLQQRDGFAQGTSLHALWEPHQTGAFLFSIDAFYTLTEMFLTANHGGVIGYKRCDDGVRPIFAPYEEEQKLREWGLSEFQKTMLEHASERLADASTDWQNLSECTAQRLAHFARNPTRDQARVFGSWPTCVDPAHQQAYELAPKMDVASMWDYFVHRKPQPVLWRAGAAAQLDGCERTLFECMCALDHTFSRCKSFVNHMLQ